MLFLFFLFSCDEPLDQKYEIFDDYNFNSGEYKLYCFGVEGKWVDGIRNFVIQDVEILNKIKSDWIFSYKTDKMACGFGYLIALVHKDSVVKRMDVNIEAEYMTCDKGWIRFPESYLSDYKEDFKILEDIEAKRLFKRYISKKNNE